ncbi:MAG: peptidoglycan bridge formation glycyltransferase FemA/FemB family protein [bacterium]|nr:peptidoglycan bridge formation glycyltransferase FemA/FemB family protein [bacterium]
MKFRVLTESEYQNFYDTYRQASFMHSLEFAKWRQEYHNIMHLVGIEEAGVIIAAALILEEKTALKKKKFYAPRGLMVDYHNVKVLSFFTHELKQYIKRRGGFTFIMDPNVIYQIRDSDGKVDFNQKKDEQTIQNLLQLGYKHHGFNTCQYRWGCRMLLDEDYEIKKSRFSKSTKRNINNCIKKGVVVRKGTILDLIKMVDLFESDSERENSGFHRLLYYQKLYQYMCPLMTVYIAYLKPDIYYQSSLNLYEYEKRNNRDLEKKINRGPVGKRLLYQKETSDKLLLKYDHEMRRALALQEKYPQGKDIGYLLSIRSGNEYLTFSSKVLPEYKSFTPNYLMYQYHIQDAYREGFQYCHFNEIVGDFHPTSKHYGLYEFKKGFGGNVIEYVGRFELKLESFFTIYKFLKKDKRITRK